MSEVFEGYERQYCELSANLSRKCTSVALLSGEQKKQKLSEIQTGVDEAEGLIRKMDLEARSLQPSLKANLLAKLREYKSDLNNLKREVKKSSLANDSQAARDELLESGMGDTLMASADQRGRLLMTTERLNQSGDRIKDSRRTLLETEDLGVSILQDLHQQRQSLLHAHDTLHGVDDNIGKSRKVLTSMSRRMSRNKWIMGGLIGLLVIVIVLIAVYKIIHK
uniref:t-SNARE coiled-coil homology domain-containing protein n=1 Tax=Araucaria cunninghamii TaxID=56994 RepID=A0A0D6R0Q5_ARACU